MAIRIEFTENFPWKKNSLASFDKKTKKNEKSYNLVWHPSLNAGNTV